jgi:hypothetical protein
MDIITGSEAFLPTIRPTMAPGRAEKAPSDGALYSPEDMRHIHSSRADRRFGELFSPAPCPPPLPHESRGRGGIALMCFVFSKTRCCTPFCSQHATHKLATLITTYSVECCKHDSSEHGKTSSQHRKSCSQHQYASQRDRRLIRSLI